MDKTNQNRFMKYLRTDCLPNIFCAGCGNGIVMNAFFRGMELAGIDFDNLALVSGIACSSRTPGYIKRDRSQTTHGRRIAFATGLKLANPELDVGVFTGDGDAAAIVEIILIHGSRRNIDKLLYVRTTAYMGRQQVKEAQLHPREVMDREHSQVHLKIDRTQLN